MDDVIYQRSPVSARMWLMPLVVWIIFAIVLILVQLGDLTGRWITIAIVVPGIVAVIWWAMLWLLDRIGCVRVTTATLTVGRSQVSVADIDLGWTRMLASRTSPQLRERVERTPGPVAVPEDESDAAVVRTGLGGMAGFEMLTLGKRDSTGVPVPTNDRAGFLAALLTAMGS